LKNTGIIRVKPTIFKEQKDESMNKTEPYLKVSLFSINFILLTFLMGQENSQMSSEWIDVQGRSSEGVKVVLREETRKIDIYLARVIDEVVKNIEVLK